MYICTSQECKTIHIYSKWRHNSRDIVISLCQSSIWLIISAPDWIINIYIFLIYKDNTLWSLPYAYIRIMLIVLTYICMYVCDIFHIEVFCCEILWAYLWIYYIILRMECMCWFMSKNLNEYWGFINYPVRIFQIFV